MTSVQSLDALSDVLCSTRGRIELTSYRYKSMLATALLIASSTEFLMFRDALTSDVALILYTAAFSSPHMRSDESARRPFNTDFEEGEESDRLILSSRLARDPEGSRRKS
jgi:hypothetical protein